MCNYHWPINKNGVCRKKYTKILLKQRNVWHKLPSHWCKLHRLSLQTTCTWMNFCNITETFKQHVIQLNTQRCRKSSDNFSLFNWTAHTIHHFECHIHHSPKKWASCTTFWNTVYLCGSDMDLRSFKIRFDSNQPFRFDSKVMGRFENFRISRACPLLVGVKRLKPLMALIGTVYRLASSMSDHTPALFDVFEDWNNEESVVPHISFDSIHVQFERKRPSVEQYTRPIRFEIWFDSNHNARFDSNANGWFAGP